MMKRNGMTWAASLWLAALASGAQAAEAQTAAKPCVPAPEAEALFMAIAPAALRELGKTCAGDVARGRAAAQSGRRVGRQV